MIDKKVHNNILFFLILTISISFFYGVQGSTDIQNQKQCHCQNNGTCSKSDKYIICDCPPGYIGAKCQIIATQISQIPKLSQLSQSYSYFYIQPKQINYYQFSLKICLPQKQKKKITSIVFVEVQTTSGKLKLQPQIYQTSPIAFSGDQERCKVFNTNFVTIRKMLNDRFQRVIFGISIKNNSDLAANNWVNLLQNNGANFEKALKNKQSSEGQLTGNIVTNQSDIQFQQIEISCSYQVYLVQNNWSSFILIVSVITLLTSTGALVYILRKSFPVSGQNQSILRIYTTNPEEFSSRQNIKNNLSHFQIMMPIMSYELVVQKQKKNQKIYPPNISYLKDSPKNEIQQKEHKLSRFESTRPNLDLNEQITYCDDSGLRIQNTCNICLLNFENIEKVRQTPCKHIFHQDCIDSWCETALNCPVCRKTLQKPPC